MVRFGLPCLQLVGTLLILGLLPGNWAKTVALLAWWAVTFGRIHRFELALALCACLLFSIMDVLALKHGVFRFTQPDWLAMPAYEFMMWGFYVLHVMRALGGRSPGNGWIMPLLLSAAFATSFATIEEPRMLLAASGAVVLVALIRYHEPEDLAYVAYMVALGAAIEYTGVHSGNWTYPGEIWGGVPLWFVSLWGGVGLFLRRLALPLFAPGAHLDGLLESGRRMKAA
jgi:hypothetical protein